MKQAGFWHGSWMKLCSREIQLVRVPDETEKDSGLRLEGKSADNPNLNCYQ